MKMTKVHMKKVGSFLAVSLFSVFTFSLAHAAGDAEAGRVKFYTCKGCHSVTGSTNAYPNYHVPRLGGQNEEYIVSALKAYKSGQRKHNSMQANTTLLNEQDMQDIAIYLAEFRKPGEKLPSTGNAVVGKEKASACAGCHGEEGNSVDKTFPRLAGQYPSYLVKVLSEYKSGQRANPIMQNFASGLSDEDMKDIAAFYASQQKGLSVSKE